MICIVACISYYFMAFPPFLASSTWAPLRNRTLNHISHFVSKPTNTFYETLKRPIGLGSNEAQFAIYDYEGPIIDWPFHHCVNLVKHWQEAKGETFSHAQFTPIVVKNLQKILRSRYDICLSGVPGVRVVAA